jgi:peptide/nickel transport system permease protein
MLRHVLRRASVSAITLLLITFAIYGLIRSMPGDPALLRIGMDVGERTVSQEHYGQMRAQMGLDRHWTTGYIAWLGRILRGDFGTSLSERRPVTEAVGPRIGPTLLLSGASVVLAFLLSIPLGLYAGARSGSLGERTLSTALYVLYSLPSFVAALYLLIVFAVGLDWFPLSGFRSPVDEWEALSPAGKVLDVLHHMILPVACLTYGSLAYYVRFIRANLQDALRQDYIRTARAKGLGEMAVVTRHAFRNSLIPLATLLGLTLPALLGGSIIIEQIFTWPGMGSLFFQKILERDYPVIMAVALLFSVLVLAGNLLADLLYAALDPRIRCPR